MFRKSIPKITRSVQLVGRPLARSSQAPLVRRPYSTYHRFNQARYKPWYENPTSIKLLGGVVVFGAGVYFTHLERTPITNRRQFILLSRAYENKLGEEQYQQILQEFRGKLLPDNHPTVLRVKRVMKPIIEQSETLGLFDCQWRVHVVHDPTQPPNAFVLPGGKVFIMSNILSLCGNDDGLATVLSHETAHQVARHSGERLSATPLYMALGIIMYGLTGSDFFNRFLMTSLLELPASRTQESEADYIGLMMMARACFDPREAPRLWQRMVAYEQGQLGPERSKWASTFGTDTPESQSPSRGFKVPEFLSTHPSSENRVARITSWLEEAHHQRMLCHCDENMGSMASSFFELRDRIW
ncbi:hypothetical protein NADFUDRAFT_80949 [Nadsonia fulvescens var. elongata DSM 6958]|uniref:Peptidase M48 domain-containing protein n=1 Tax=Nadsonia fulvescens var. elongata DSM 6958 TaxID=857566 RepID=A0A1E3PQR7_9ASCO|nr:hypothetical protein NADFUDRAFT_80949 [Nadsonia fulvescens var. elongata DSM 6958]